MSGLNSDFIASLDLNPYFSNTIDAEALANGTLRFFVDTNRTQPKTVYRLTQGSGSPPNYSYTPMPNPITLSANGTIEDANGNQVALYYHPFDAFGNQELYYIEAYDQNNNLQFTREAWPFPFGASDVENNAPVGLSNQITNPQFTSVLFDSVNGLTMQLTGSSTTVVDIAPGWQISVVHTGAATVTLTQVPVAGSQAYPFNPPYVLQIVSSGSITELRLIQTFANNPSWAAPQVFGVMGFVASSILLGPNTSAQMIYISSAGNVDQTLLNDTNSTGIYTQFSNTIELEPAANPQSPPSGNDKIAIQLNPVGTSIIGNVQVLPLTSNVSGLSFDQTTVNRQNDLMFNYYNPLLQAKPIPSYLVAWDFPLNPAQFLGSGTSGAPLGPFATGVNTSNYIWDQTIVYQSADSGIKAYRGNNGELVLKAAADTQMAVIQYLTGTQINEILNNRLSVNVEANTSKTAGYVATVSLWYSIGSALPSTVTSNLSIVSTLDANGYPTAFNQPTGGTWKPMPRSGLGNTTGTTGGSDAQFRILPAQTRIFNDYQLSGWDLQISTDSQTANFFAIVVGTSQITIDDTIAFNSISLVPGDIATRPAPQKPEAVIQDCQQYYWKSYDMNVTPGTSSLPSMITKPMFTFVDPGTTTFSFANAFTVDYPVSMVSDPNIAFYSTNGAIGTAFAVQKKGNVVANSGNVTFATWWAQAGLGTNRVSYTVNSSLPLLTVLVGTGNSAASNASYIQFHVTADARLGQ